MKINDFIEKCAAAGSHSRPSPGLRQGADRVGPTPEQLGQDPGLRTAEGATRTARWWLDEYGCEMQYA